MKHSAAAILDQFNVAVIMQHLMKKFESLSFYFIIFKGDEWIQIAEDAWSSRK